MKVIFFSTPNVAVCGEDHLIPIARIRVHDIPTLSCRTNEEPLALSLDIHPTWQSILPLPLERHLGIVPAIAQVLQQDTSPTELAEGVDATEILACLILWIRLWCRPRLRLRLRGRRRVRRLRRLIPSYDLINKLPYGFPVHHDTP
jgi:hypothetical protein